MQAFLRVPLCPSWLLLFKGLNHEGDEGLLPLSWQARFVYNLVSA
jgi:hypothetical protein